MRRSGAAARCAFGALVLDFERAELARQGVPIPLRPKTFALLVYLVDRAGSVVPKQELLDAVWPGRVVSDDSLTQAISELRSALGEQGPALIRTLLRRGYRFDGDVRPVQVSAPAAPVQPVMPLAAPAALAGPGLPRWALRGVAAAFGAAAVAMLWLGVAQTRASRPPLDAALAQSLSIAVLPFADLSEPPAPHLAYAVDDELATDLGRRARLRVVARSSAVVLAASGAADSRQVGRELDVRYLLTGSVRRVGDAVSINVRLLRTGSGELLWSTRFEYGSVADWAQRREISARVANVIDTKLTLAAMSDPQRQPRSHPALDDWIRGRYILYRLPQRADLPEAKAELMQARGHFEAALAAEPDSVEAIAGLSFSHLCEVIYRWSADRQATLATAAALARRALAIDPNDITALKALAGAQMFDGDLEGAMITTRRQLEINPSDAHSNRDLAATLYFLGRWEEALRQLDLAERLNPLDSSHLDKVHSMASIALIALKRYDEAIDRARRLGAVLPRGAGPYLTAAAAHAHRGDLDAARQAAAEVLRLRPQFLIGGMAQRGSTAPAYIEGLRHVDEGLRLAGLPERPASPAR